jgi:Leucine-rich repeat (LRR) protein
MLENNQLKELPESIGESIGCLENLTDLDLRTNKLDSIPDSVGNLKKLRCLDLRDNRLTSLTDGIRNLANLEKLDVRLNKNLKIPFWFKELEQRGWALLHKCPDGHSCKDLKTV